MTKYVAYNQAKQKLDALRTPQNKPEPQKQDVQRSSITEQTNDENHANLNIDKYWQKKQPVINKKPSANCGLLSRYSICNLLLIFRLKDADDVVLNVTLTPKKTSKSEDSSTKQTHPSTVPPFSASKPKAQLPSQPQPQPLASTAPEQTTMISNNSVSNNNNNEATEMDPESLSVVPFSQINQSSRWRRSSSLLQNKEKLHQQLEQLQHEIEQDVHTSEDESDTEEAGEDVSRTPKRLKTETNQSQCNESQNTAMDVETTTDERTLTAASLARSFSGTRSNFVKQKLKSSIPSSPFGKFRKSKTNFTSFKKLKRLYIEIFN